MDLYSGNLSLMPLKSETRFISNQHQIFFLKIALLVVLVADLLTGLGSLKGISLFNNLSFMARFVFLIFTFLILGVPRSFFSKAWLPLQFVVFITILPLLLQFFIQGLDMGILRNYLKFLYPYLLLVLVWGISRDNKIRLLSFIFEIYLASLLLTYLFKIGKTTYLSGLGWKGLFYAGNELSALLLITFPFFLAHHYHMHKLKILKIRTAMDSRFRASLALASKVSIALKLAFTSLLTLLPATKSIILGVPLIVNIVLRKILSRGLFWFFVGVSILVSIYPAYIFLYKRLLRTMARTETLTMAIYEKRFYQLIKYFEHIRDYPMQAISGLGVQAREIGGASTELDFFDYAINYGLVSAFVFFVALVIMLVFYHCEIKRQFELRDMVFVVSGVFYLGLSLFVGHCVFSGIVAVPFAIVFSEIFSRIRFFRISDRLGKTTFPII